MRTNDNNGTEFVLLAFKSYKEYQLVFCIGVLLMYLLALFGNMMIIAFVCMASQLHSPMYFFLCNLSVQDIIYVSAILPKLLVITISGNTSISFNGCITQMFTFAFCVGTEFFLLSSMAYDRYVAICIPLHYSLIMNVKICAILATMSWLLGALNSLLHSLLMSCLSFGNVHTINHFFCDVKTLLKLSSSDTTKIQILISVEGIVLGCIPFLLIMISYGYIIATILRIHNSEGRLRAFSSCSSHLTVVILFCGTFLSLNLKPGSEHSEEQDKLLSMVYIAVVPVLNPLVYSLRNKEVLKVMKRQLLKK
ncbi:olfactory receptor 13F1-like [Rhinophrynus dorsalis]